MATFFFTFQISFLFAFLSSLVMTSIDAASSVGLILKNGGTLVSPNHRFQLGFFNASPTQDPNREFWFFGIWYRGVEPLTTVWVANRLNPLRGIDVSLHMSPGGDLLLHDDEGNAISFVRLNQPVSNPLLVLLDSGNLVIKDGNETTQGNYYWQSFDFPSDTLLPGMKLGWDLKSRSNRVMTSWVMSSDPGYGDFVLSIKSPTAPQLLLEKSGVVQSRWGPWSGRRFSGSNIEDNPLFRVIYHYSPDEVYFMFQMLDDSIVVRLVVTSIGSVQFLKWENTPRVWAPLVTLTSDICDRYGLCGPYATCFADEPGCQCLKGFLVNSPHDWQRFDYSDGCGRQNPLKNCSNGDGFVKYSGLKLPDNFTVIRGLSLEECGDYCLKNCNCMAYTSISLYGHDHECVVWLDKLIDIRAFKHDGDELYIRMARVELDAMSHSKSKKDIVIISSIVITAFLGAAFWCAMRQFRSLSRSQNQESVLDQDNEQYVQTIDINIISAATTSFSMENKIGQGGFGPVYEGQFQNGQKIAVKRLSETSNQGLREFKNEVNMIAQLQHRNLVKLLGCCIHGEERMLVYEYMQNKSLDQFLFDTAKKSLLTWAMRFSILKGVAKGLDYLHYGSRMRVVHRDLKASNILLDESMNPKISDFGLARNCENDMEEITKRVIGTHGYMSPEYVIDGHYSTKSDVYSFGVLVMEIINGQRNWGFQHPDHEYNLLGHAWKWWTEGRALELIDSVLEGSIVESEVSRCVQIGLLCAQHNSDERPTMPQVVSMLENESVRLVEPQEPGFFTRRSAAGHMTAAAGLCSSMDWANESVNGLTVTDLTGRL